MDWKIIIGILGLVALALPMILLFLTKDPIWIRPTSNEDLPHVSKETLRNHVERLSIDFFPRSSFHIDNLNKTAAYIRDQFQNYGCKVSDQTFDIPVPGSTTYRNIRVTFPGSSYDQRPLVIGAHYDAIAETPGADDNASAVSVLIELAGLLQNHPPKIPVHLIALTNEESPFFGTEAMGAIQAAQDYKQKNQKIRGMISLEMLGYYTNKPNSQKYPLKIMHWFYPNQGNFLAFVSITPGFSMVRKAKRLFAKSSAFPIESFVGPRMVEGLLRSDHYAFLIHDFPAIMITDTAYNRNFNYHTMEDSADRLDYEAMAEITRGLFGMIQEWP